MEEGVVKIKKMVWEEKEFAGRGYVAVFFAFWVLLLGTQTKRNLQVQFHATSLDD